jgi:SAM-dependent methyltransferase
MLSLAWNDRSTRTGSCPLCGHSGQAPQILRFKADQLRHLAGREWLSILQCPVCEIRYCDPMVSVDYSDVDEDGLKYYLEKGAGIDVMLEALALADGRKVSRYLEIGCSFGFVMDYARRMLGWEVRGFDPGAIARAGRRLLDLPIENGFFQASSGLAGWADLVYCSEVIEHVPQPGAFLRSIRSALREDGQLILTTPDGDALTEQAAPEVLLPILSPGHHIVLFNAASIERLLRACGFTAIRIERNRSQLRVAASLQPIAGRSACFDRARYLDYLRLVTAEHAADTPIGAGLAYRLFKELVNAGRFDEARGPYFRLRDAYEARYGLDIDDSACFAFPDGAIGLAELGRSWPFNLGGVWYFRGIIEFLAESDPAKAAASFDASRRFGTALRRVLASMGTDDMELADLGRQAELARLSALAQCDPREAVAVFRHLMRDPPAADPAGREAFLALAARRLFTDLGNLGRYAQAEELLACSSLDPEQALAQRDLPAVFAYALYLMNHKAAFAAAAALLDRLAAAAAAQPDAAAFFWQSRFHRGLARLYNGDAADAAAVAAEIEEAAAHGATVPADILRRIRELTPEKRS